MAEINKEQNKIALIGAIVIVALLIMTFIVGGLILLNYSDTKEPSTLNETTNAVPETPDREDESVTEPSNPNVTGGSTGAGTTSGNDSSQTTPSPAGGVDTNEARP